MPREFKRHTVAAALPYANGPVHIGHLAGVYVPADIYVRYLRAAGRDVLFVGGSDELGIPITLRAKNEGVTPQEIVDRYHAIIKRSFEEFGISFDVYSRTSARIHWETSSEFFKHLYDQGVFIEKTSEQYYDQQNKQFLADRYIQGTCPNCSYDAAYGDQCENCGTSLSPDDLIDPKSMLSGAVPIKKKTKHWYLPMDKYEDWLKQWILEEHKEWKPNVYGQCKSWLDQGLNPRAMTRDLDWGIPVPLPDAEGKVLYVWFDAPIGYISATKEWAQENQGDWEPYWKDKDTKLVHFIGKDNIVFHCIIFPVLLKAHGEYILPDNVPANEFLNLEGGKVSTSRNWAVWLHEYLEAFPGKQDVLRYTLCAIAPETKDSDFTWKDFQARNNNELVAILGNFINRTMVLTSKYYEGIVPEKGKLQPVDEALIDQVSQAPRDIANAIEHYKFREAQSLMMEVARWGNKYLADNEPWKLIKTNPERVQTIMNISLQLAANLSILTGPFLPFSSKKLRGMMNLQPSLWESAGKFDLLKTGHQLAEPELLFEKIEDPMIQKQIDKLEATKDNVSDTDLAPAKETITYDDFIKMDMRIGTIKAAERVPKSKKLLKLEVATGLDTRTVVSGIAEHYSPEEIIGQPVTMLLNLAPRKIMGVESQGMILMAENQDGKLAFLQPDKEINDGGLVS